MSWSCPRNDSSQDGIIGMKLGRSLWFGGEATYFNATNNDDACVSCYGGISFRKMAVGEVACSAGTDDCLAPAWYGAALC